MNEIAIYICNYNTNQLTNNCIKSIINNIKRIKYSIFVFDNSDVLKFDNVYNINVLDNTDGQIINFVDYIKNYKGTTNNNYGSAKHTITIDYIIKTTPFNNIMLLDSDTVLLKDIDFLDSKYITISDCLKNNYFILRHKQKVNYEYENKCTKKKHTHNNIFRKRLLPFIQYFNIKKIKDCNINYYDSNRIIGSSDTQYPLYDTGASFYEDILNNNCDFKIINHKDYIIHYGHGSWGKND